MGARPMRSVLDCSHSGVVEVKTRDAAAPTLGPNVGSYERPPAVNAVAVSRMEGALMSQLVRYAARRDANGRAAEARY